MTAHRLQKVSTVHAIIVRYGELGLKGKNRPEFEDLLGRRLRQALRDLPGARVRKGFGRFFVDPGEAEADAALARVARVFGVVSASAARKVAPDLDSIRAAARELVASALPPGEGAVRFRVDARRADKRFPLTSQALNERLGADLLRAFPRLVVDLRQPQLAVSVEVREDAAYVFTGAVPGPGGLPYGSGGRALLLLSGGIDSPVAGWLAMRRGVEIEPVHFHSFPFTSERSKEKVVDLTRVLASWVGPIRLHMVSVTAIQKAIRLHCPEELHITILRRFMLRIAESLARRRDALALVTGESVGQVASQTLESLRTIEAVSRLPVLRPVIALDKTEIVALARRIGTYEISIEPHEDCCSLFVPRNPKTRPRPEQAERAEAALDVEALVAEAVEAAEELQVESPPGEGPAWPPGGPGGPAEVAPCRPHPDGRESG